MWPAIIAAASSVLGKAASTPDYTSTVSGAPNFIDASFDSSQWTVATSGATARAENSKVDVPPVAAANLATQSPAPYVALDSGVQPVTAGLGGLDMQSILPVVLLAAGLALVVRKK